MQACLDPITIEHLAALDVGPGWSCLEVGAGGGSIARWLGRQVGPGGHVLATDLDTGRTDPGPDGPVQVRWHDITTDVLPEAAFDLVHARLVLLHLPQRLRALAAMVRAVKPGGWLLLDEFDCTWMPVLAGHGQAVFARFHAALCAVLTEAGADIAWGSHAYAALAEQGMDRMGAAARAQAWPGGSTGSRWLQVNIAQLGGRLVATGLVSAGDLAELRELLDDPGFVVSSYLVVSTWGRRPG
nr:methyltransferase domain-containing protein [Saccharopolyspora sp. HNM0983]